MSAARAMTASSDASSIWLVDVPAWRLPIATRTVTLVSAVSPVEVISFWAKRVLPSRRACTRAVLKRDSAAGPDGPVYAGTCRDAGHDARRHALRARVPDRQLCFMDELQGQQCRDLPRDVGDFVVRRANGEFAYQLACAVDEHAQGITDVVRGADLLGSTFCQLWVLRELDLAAPRYAHLPVLVDARGRKLSKQNHAAPVDAAAPVANLKRCLALLNQPVPDAATPAGLLEAAAAAWDATRVSRTAQIGDLPL